MTERTPLRHTHAAAALPLTFMILIGMAVAQEKTPEAAAAPSASELAGAWVGTLSHSGDTQPIALRFEPGEGGGIEAKLSVPVVHVWEVPIGKAAPEPGQVRIGSTFLLEHDRAAGTLSGTMPAALVPVHRMSVTFRRGNLERPPRPEPSAPIAKPVWTFDAGAPVWADAVFADGVVYLGADDGRLHALEARTGKALWAFRAGGPIRARATRSSSDVFVQADNGFLYKIDARNGTERFKVRVCEKPIERLPPEQEGSRFDRFASGATLAGGKLYLGTHDGRVLALDPEQGSRLWDFAAGDTVLSTPVVSDGPVYFGSFDGNVYAVAAASGALVWKHDTKAPVVSTPAILDGRVIVGSRSYDLFGLDAQSGKPVWTRYIWFSWVESPVSVRDATGYVGSSDAAKLFAFETGSGRSVWELDVQGWAWGQPAVTDERVFIGTTGTGQYITGHRGALLAADRKTGQLEWRHLATPAADGKSYGFPASPAVGAGLVFIGGLDGRVYAFAQ